LRITVRVWLRASDRILVMDLGFEFSAYPIFSEIGWRAETFYWRRPAALLVSSQLGRQQTSGISMDLAA
jgi:hypothetical protein